MGRYVSEREPLGVRFLQKGPEPALESLGEQQKLCFCINSTYRRR